MTLAGDYEDRFGKSFLNDKMLEDAMDHAIQSASLITDFRFNDQTENCKSMVGYRVYTHKTGQFGTFFVDGR